MSSFTLAIGQYVHWRHARDGVAQIDDLRRSNVRLVYRDHRGHWRFRILPAASAVQLINAHPLLLTDLRNPLGRAAPARTRTYEQKGVEPGNA